MENPAVARILEWRKERKKIKRHEKYERDREKEIKNAKKWQKENPEQALELARAWKARNPERTKEGYRNWVGKNYERKRQLRRKSNYKIKYGITIEEFNAIFLAQGNACACCRTTKPGSKRGWHVDHCHITGIVRGILCHHCNVALGYTKDNTKTLENMITYLKRYTNDKYSIHPTTHLPEIYEVASFHAHDLWPSWQWEDHIGNVRTVQACM
jgi:hypothetical protein